MKIDLYAVCYNEEVMLPFFLKHYEKIVDRIFIYDNMSTDSSQDILKSHSKVIMNTFDTGGKCCEVTLTKIRNEEYKKFSYDCDYVVIVDIDEILYHPRILDLLSMYKKKGIECVHSVGYKMISNHDFLVASINTQIYDVLRIGVFDKSFDKINIFDPKKIDIQYGYGSHDCKGCIGAKMPRERAVKLLHYKWLNYPQLLAKHKHRMSSLSNAARKLHLSGCEVDADKMKAHFEEIKASSFDVLLSKCPPYHSKLRVKLVDFLFYYLRGGRRRWVQG